MTLPILFFVNNQEMHENFSAEKATVALYAVLWGTLCQGTGYDRYFYNFKCT